MTDEPKYEPFPVFLSRQAQEFLKKNDTDRRIKPNICIVSRHADKSRSDRQKLRSSFGAIED